MRRFLRVVYKVLVAIVVTIGVVTALGIVAALVAGCNMPMEPQHELWEGDTVVNLRVQAQSAYRITIDGRLLENYATQQRWELHMRGGVHYISVSTAEYAGGGLLVTATDENGHMLQQQDSHGAELVYMELYVRR